MTPSFFLQDLISSLPRPFRRMRIARLLSLLSRSKGYHGIRFQSGSLVGHISEGQVAHTLVSGHFEDYGFFDIADKLLANGGVYFDIGANFGFHTFGLEKFKSSICEIHMFEPNPICCRSIRFSLEVQRVSSRYLVEAGLSDATGIANLRFCSGTTSQGYIRELGHGEKGQDVAIDLLTLDTYCHERDIKHIKLIKMDIEGNEWHALQGAAGMFTASLVDFCYFEVNQIALERRGVSLKTLFDFFLNNGYVLCWPHVSASWILPRLLPDSRMQALHYTNAAEHVLEFTRFDPAALSFQLDHQFDLIAISPKLKLATVD